MGSIKIPQWVEKLADVADKRLDDGSLATSLTTGELPEAALVVSGGLSGVFGLAANAEIELFNGNDVDTNDGVVGAKPAGTPSTVDWRPVLHPSAGKTWLKYALTASASAKATSTIGCAAGAISGDRQLRVVCYRRHTASETVAKAIASDLGGFYSPLLPGEILQLKDEEATALKIRGKLTATLTLKWADIFSTSLHQLTSLAELAGSGPILLNVGTDASATFNIQVDDDFTLCFARQSGGDKHPIRVAMRKSIKHDARFEATAGIAVAFADPNSVAAVVTNLLDGVLSVPDGFVKDINKIPTLDAVPGKYQAAVKLLLERFGVTGTNALDELKQQLVALQKKASDGIDTLAKQKVELGFRYEYMRLSTEASLLEMALSEQALQQLHGALLGFDFAKVLAHKGTGMSLDFYLHQKTVERVRAWGFSLGIGTWLNLKSNQEQRHLFVRREYETSQQKLETRSYTGTTRYSASFNTWNTEYGALLKADKESAGLQADKTAIGLKCGMEVWWEESKLELPGSAERIADDSVLWGAIGPEDYHATVARLKALPAGKCKARLNMQISDYGTQQALILLGTMEAQDWARHAARALAQKSTIDQRETCTVRGDVYLPVFEAYALNKRASGLALRNLVSNALRREWSRLATQEYEGKVGTVYFVLSRFGNEPGAFWRAWDRLREGASRMRELFVARGEWTDLRHDFDQIAPIFENTYTIRIVASLLADRLPEAVQGGRGFTSTLTIEQDGQVSVISS